MMTERSPKVLVVGINFLMTWRVVVSLRAAGHTPSLLTMPHAALPGSLLVRREQQRSFPAGMRVYDGTRCSPEARRSLEKAAADFDVVIPADLDTTEACAHLPSLSQQCLVPSPEVLSAIHNKWKFTQQLTALGIAVPGASVLLPDCISLSRFSPQRPTVVKPLDASAGKGVVIIRNRVDAERLANDHHTQYPLIAQDHIPGWDLGVSVLARKGRILAANVWERPVEGARDFLGTNSPLAQRLLADASRILAGAAFTGVGHFDAMRYAGTHRYAFLEFNPRYWGSLLYSNAYGTNFTALNVHHVMRPEADRDMVPQRGRRVFLSTGDRLLQRAIPAVETAFAQAEKAQNLAGRLRLGVRVG